MSRLSTSRIYDFYGGFYDVFEVFFQRRIGRALGRIPFQQGDRVLDVGVGTGFSLRHYPEYVHVTGIDNSTRMLASADRKVRDGLVQAPTRLIKADALDLPFPNGKFDVVVLSHVIATVADPVQCLTEALRVTREHGILLLVNHFQSTTRILRRLERWCDPLCRKLGWRNDLALADLLSRGGVINPHDPAVAQSRVFQVVYLQKSNDAARVITLPEPATMSPTLNPA
ncbi:MAG TPA: class I SAM-dependent methyltransferase [Phycisphaerae bacterium]|nr:class I SAM-dependent methyltransferase [Phycisphaerae bacterium]